MFLSKLTNKKVILVSMCSCVIGIIGTYLIIQLGATSDNLEEDWVAPWELEVQSQGPVNRVEDQPIEIYVDIKGEVLLPGIYELSEGDRVFAAIELAGGFTENAEELALNLAQKCYDEMVIYVPSILGEGDFAPTFTSTQPMDGKIRVNQASVEELTTIPGIGPAKAGAIIQYREENGAFQKIEDLVNVPGIGDKTLDNMKEFIKVP